MKQNDQGSAGVPPAMVSGQDARSRTANGGQDARPPLVLVDPHEKVDVHRHRLPHWQQGQAAHFVTWRLADSLPRDKLEIWKRERDVWLRVHPEPWDVSIQKQYHKLFSDRLDAWLDAGAGSCVLRDPENRRIVSEALRHFDGQRYDLWAFVVMPNHIHVLFSLRPPNRIERILHSWKSYTAKVLARRLGQRGAIWQEDYWDRLIRSREHFDRCGQYICNNPSAAQLAMDEYTLFHGSAGVAPAIDGGQDARSRTANGGQDARPPL